MAGLRNFIIGFVSGIGSTVLILILVGAFLNSTAMQPGPPITPLKGVFYGQVVDAFTLDPIPNATVHLCSGKSLDDLVTTVITNASGYYGTTNITLSEAGGTFYVSAEASGYYTEPLGPSANSFSEYETASEINPSVYSISPIKLYRISSDAKMAVEIQSLSDGLFVIAENYTYQLLNSNRLDFNVVMWNHQLNTAAGSPYYENKLKIVSTPLSAGTLVHEPRLTASIFPATDINEPALIYANSFQWNPMRIEHFTVNFPTDGLTRVTLVLNENPYPDFYNFRQHLSLSFTFWVNVTWS